VKDAETKFLHATDIPQPAKLDYLRGEKKLRDAFENYFQRFKEEKRVVSVEVSKLLHVPFF
jgi:hypothetical protein